MARKTHKGKPQAKSAHAQAKRLAAKHQARRTHGRLGGSLGWLPAGLRKYVRAALDKQFHVPKLDLDLHVLPALAGVVVLAVAVGAGYWGAQSLFGGGVETAHQRPTKNVVIQQTHSLRGVILSEDDAEKTVKTAYEEKVLEEVYTPPEPAAPEPATEVAPEPEIAPKPVVEVENYEVAWQGGKPLWLKNAIAYAPPKGKPQISIVIDDMGVDRRRSKAMWEEVTAPLTLSFMTYADDLPEQTRAARSKGHELMLHMSMEPSSSTIDAGANVLLTAMPTAEIRSLANWGMNRFEGFVAVNNHMGSRFTEDERGMRVVMEEIKKKGLFFLDSRTSSRTVGRRIAREVGLPVLERNVFLDNENIPEKVLAQLYETERIAQKYGHAIAIGHPRDATIKVLKTWIEDARSRGFSIVPISTLMKKRLYLNNLKLKG
ncbi:MAG: divergent polysaccharide deacetylase family protein [Magnetovibrio sp.]|nr:divergent polysaccharide deacetylase family protein [Magnetovibrio sp.]